MRAFFAILRDSFREAVDGFVIYAMLALAGLVMLVVGSMSYTPAQPPEALDKIVQQFNMVFPDRGRSRAMTGSGGATFKAEDVQPAGGGYKLRLVVKGTRPFNTPAEVDGKPADPPQGEDGFRETVAQWVKPPGKVLEFEVPDENKGAKQGKGSGRKAGFAVPVSVTAEEKRAITDEQMTEFLKNQFYMTAGMDATATRVAGVKEPEYAFDVTTTGGSAVRGWPHTVKIFFGAVTIDDDTPLGMVLWIVEDQIINGMGGVIALLISVIITAFFIPNMMRKGSIDLLIAKPIGRSQLLVYKYIGGLTFIFLVTAFTVGGIWFVIGLRSGYWAPDFLVVIPVLTFTFAILYAVSVAAAVFTRSPIVAILASLGFAVFLYIVGKAKQWADNTRSLKREGNTPEWVFTVIDGINTALPRYKDLDNLTSKLIADGTLTPAFERLTGLGGLNYPSWGATFGMSLVFIAVVLALSCWRFSRRDY